MRIKIVLLSCFFCLLYTPAFCDLVYLVNGCSIEGVIEKEGSEKITLNIGYGKIALEKKDIVNIQRYNPNDQDELVESWNFKYFSRPEFIPENLKDLATDFDNLKNFRDLAVGSKKIKDKVKKESEKLERDLRDLNKNLTLVSEQLSAAKPEDDLEKYNSLVNEFNSLMAKIKVTEYNKGELEKNLKKLEKNISDYINDFGLFRNRFSKRYSVSELEHRDENVYFFKGVKKELDEMENDFTKHAADFQRDGLNIVVDVLLNGTFLTRLMVDTGASLVVLSKGIAGKLGIDNVSKNPSMFLTLADGRKVPANPVILESVKVGDVEVKNVQAAVLETVTENSQEEFGLLGMSFLENFVVRMDAKSNRLIFEEFNP